MRLRSPQTRARWIATFPLMKPTIRGTTYFGGVSNSAMLARIGTPNAALNWRYCSNVQTATGKITPTPASTQANRRASTRPDEPAPATMQSYSVLLTPGAPQRIGNRRGTPDALRQLIKP